VEMLERAFGVRPITALQSELSLWTQEPLQEVLPWCVARGVSFVPFAPLGRGFLTGGYRSGDVFQEDDFRAILPRFQRGTIERNLGIVDQIRVIARRVGATLPQLSLAWLLAKGDQIVPIPGTTSILHLEENLGAIHVVLTPEDLAGLDALPKPLGDRY